MKHLNFQDFGGQGNANFMFTQIRGTSFLYAANYMITMASQLQTRSKLFGIRRFSNCIKTELFQHE